MAENGIYSEILSYESLYAQIKNLTDENTRLQSLLNEKAEVQFLCPVTKLPNGGRFNAFLHDHIAKIAVSSENQRFCLIFISVDNLARIKYLYGDREVDEVLRNIAYLLNDFKSEQITSFRLHGATFAVSCPGLEKREAVALAEGIRNKVAEFIGFVEKITVSLGVVEFSEVMNDPSLRLEADKSMYELAQKRIGIAKSIGMNIVCSESDTERAKEAGLGRVLVVDTDRVNVSFLQNYLEDNHFSVLTAFDGMEALQIAQQERPDVIICEAMLPKVDGFFLKEKLMADSGTKGIYFIMVSHLKNEDSVQRAIGLEIEHYFKKPYMIAEIIGIVKKQTRGVML